MKCRCAMCGKGDARRCGRRSFARVGILTYEKAAKGGEKVLGRRLRRRRESSGFSATYKEMENIND